MFFKGLSTVTLFIVLAGCSTYDEEINAKPQQNGESHPIFAIMDTKVEQWMTRNNMQGISLRSVKIAAIGLKAEIPDQAEREVSFQSEVDGISQ